VAFGSNRVGLSLGPNPSANLVSVIRGDKVADFFLRPKVSFGLFAVRGALGTRLSVQRGIYATVAFASEVNCTLSCLVFPQRQRPIAYIIFPSRINKYLRTIFWVVAYRLWL